TTFTDLSQKPEVISLVTKDIERVNKSIPVYSRIKTFANLHKELDPDEAELTRTRKLRRGFLKERYGGLIEAIFNNQPEFEAEAQITYRDGRKGTIKTTVKINAMDIGD
ncbi:AMP-binding protein, partial [Bacteroidota bacterium]